MFTELDTKLLAKDIRVSALRMANLSKGSHIGSVFSIADILAVLYGRILLFRPQEPSWENRDWFILSKGHAGAGVYAALAAVGFFDKMLLDSHYQNNSRLSGHVSSKKVPGVELSTGSLGMGLGVSAGIAYSKKLDDRNESIFCILSDGECDEGSTWEAAMFAGHQKLSQLTIIIDYNKLQSIKTTTETLNLEPFREKWESFGWDTIQIDGHCHESLFSSLRKVNSKSNKPRCIIANTVKGKGVSFMENNVLWHYRSPQNEEYEAAMRELLKKP